MASKAKKIEDEALNRLEQSPLVTMRRLWLGVYVLLGLTGISMLVARVLFRPLFVAIIEARSDRFSMVLNRLRLLKDEMQKSVATVPSRNVKINEKDGKVYMDSQTQTSPQTSPRLTPIDGKSNVSTDQEDRSTSLIRLSELVTPMNLKGDDELLTTLARKVVDLRDYLDGFTSSRVASGVINSESAMQRFKTEVRGVKGSVLNARSFRLPQSRLAQ